MRAIYYVVYISKTLLLVCTLFIATLNFIVPLLLIHYSGILSYQAEDVVQTYSEFFDDVKVEREQAGWVLITGTRK